MVIERAGDAIAPLDATSAEFIGQTTWKSSEPLAFRLARLWGRYAPRGKGAVPRLLARTAREDLYFGIETANGLKLAVVKDAWDSYVAALREAWDKHIMRVCSAVLDDGQVLYDIGANIGIISLSIMKEHRGGIRVVAFEPQAHLAHALTLSTQLNDFQGFDTYCTLVGEDNGAGTLFVPHHSVHASMISREDNARAVDCKATSIDALLAANGPPPPHVIKLDVEGGERGVIRGAADTIRRHQPIIVFESDVNCARFGYTRRDVVDDLRALTDYDVYLVGPTEVKPVADDLEDPTFSDVMVAPPHLRHVVQRVM